MAEKRPLGTLGPVMYSKLPRLEADSGPGHSLPPSAGNQDPCSYKGTYYSCPKAGSERLTSWSPYPTLYPTSIAGPPLRADNLLTNCLLYRPPAEGSEKMQDSSHVDVLPFSPQAHAYTGPPLAAPKPVYRSPLCYGLSSCLREGATKRPLDMDWTLVPGPLLPSADPPCSLAPASGKGQHLDGTFLHGVPPVGPGKDNSLGFSPCQAFLEKYRTIHSTGYLASKYTGSYSGDPKQAMSEGPSSPWTQLAQPLGPPCQEAVPTQYPLPPPPQTLPCPPACRHPEKQGSYNSVLPLGVHKGSGYQVGGLSSHYLRQQAAQAPYVPPVGLDTYSYSSTPLPAPSPGLKLEPPLAPRCPLDFAPPTLAFPYARDDLTLYGASPGLGGAPPSQNSVQPVPQLSAFQRTCQPLPASRPCSEPVRPAVKPAQEAEEKRWLPSCRKEQPRRSEHAGVPIVIRDSPVPRASPALHPCAQEPQSSAQKEGTGPSSSPPMPVIDNVFSLAPYRDYLDARPPEATAEPDSTPATSESQDQEGASGACCPPREDMALDLSVKKSSAETVPIRVSSPAVLVKSIAAVDVPHLESSLLGLPGLKKMVTEAPGTSVTTEARPRTNFIGAPEVPVTTEAVPRANITGAPGMPVTTETMPRTNFTGAPEVPVTTEAVPRTSFTGAPGMPVTTEATPRATFTGAHGVPMTTEATPRTTFTGASGIPVTTEATPRTIFTRATGMPRTMEAMPTTNLTGTPEVPVTTEATPRTNFHSSVAFMFRKFKILRPAPLPAAVDPSTSAPAPAPSQPAPTLSPVPVGLQLLAQPLPVTCFNLALPSSPAIAAASPAPAPAPAPVPIASPVPDPASAPPPALAPAPVSTAAPADSTEQHFTGLHTSLCDAISGSVAHSPPEKLREWLEMTGPWGQAAWQDCQGVQGLLSKLLSQLQRFVSTQQCPFPHVVRAGAIFVPIHLVKERLFPRLPPASVDHVLQEHRVELRPTTLSEERALRERALHGCTSRMLKLLALRQLPDIYPDLLGLQWHDCVRRQLGNLDTEAGAVSPSEPTVAKDEPESPALARKSPAPKVRKPGKKPPGSPGTEKAEAAAGGSSRGLSPTPAASASPPGPTLRARFRTLLESAWLNGLALPTWGHKPSGPDRTPAFPQLLDSQSHPL